MLKNYLKIALKVLLRRKFFTFISLFGISFTLLVLMVASAMLDHVFSPRAPETRLNRTLGLYYLSMTGPYASTGGFPGYAFLNRYGKDLPKVEASSIFQIHQLAASYLGDRKIESYLKRTDGEYWQILDFEFLEGAPFTVDDERSRRFVAVINETTRTRFFGSEAALGRRLKVDGQTFEVVGVVPDVPILRIVPFADIWVPLSTTKSTEYRQGYFGNFVQLLLAENAEDIPEIQADFQARLAEAEIPDPRQYNRMTASAETFFEFVARLMFNSDSAQNVAPRLKLLLLGAGLLFMLLPAVNLININLSRILERSSEIGVRKAFGASAMALVGQFLVENLVVTLLGGLIGFLLSGLALAAINSSGLIPYAQFGLNLRVFFYGLAIAVIFGILSGVYPAWRMSRTHPVEALRGRLT